MCLADRPDAFHAADNVRGVTNDRDRVAERPQLVRRAPGYPEREAGLACLRWIASAMVLSATGGCRGLPSIG